jgi:hypothetical protein
MTELDAVWFKMLGESSDAAKNSGREDVADYLRLRASNDAIRHAGVEWLYSTLVEVAAPAMRDHRNLTIDRLEPHNFRWENSNMVGSRLEIRLGVRCLTVEAGWARTPSDGIMRTGALAFARLLHFGFPGATEEFRLFHNTSLPTWLTEDNVSVRSEHIRRHIALLLD